MILRSRYVISADREPIENGAIRVEGGRIAEVGRAADICTAASRVTDFGDAVILPGLINSHTHLELSFLHERLSPTAGFMPWLRALAAGLAADPPGADAIAAAVQDGVRKSLAAGVTVVADITRFPQNTRPVLLRSHLRAVSFGEVIAVGSKRGLLRDRIRAAVDGQQLPSSRPAGTDGPDRAMWRSPRGADAAENVAERLQIGISPHSPYSVEIDGLRECARWADQNGLPLCIHLAESPEELEFVLTGAGALAEFLRDLGVWDGETPTIGCSPVEAAANAGLLTRRTVVAHANYVTDQDIALLAGSGASVAYCPRTHAAFGHPPHRFCDMLRAGINVCVGTDSLASNPSLSILDELRYLRCLYPNLEATDLLEMGTIRGSRALGLDQVTGSLVPGKSADFVVVPLANSAVGWDDVLDSRSDPLAVYLAGQRPSQAIPFAA